jgi:hypothetical protein
MEHPDTQDETAMFRSLGIAARTIVMSTPVESCDHFRGLYLKGKLDVARLEDLFRGLPAGLTEFMVHPGRPADSAFTGSFSGFSTMDRERELIVLLDPSLPVFLEKYGISLTPFPEGLP